MVSNPIFNTYEAIEFNGDSMGEIIESSCPCGYHREFCRGGGMQNFATVDMEPAYCPHCRDMVIVNNLDRRPMCPICGWEVIFYNDPSLFSDQDVGTYIWRDFELPSEKCLCPKCGNMTLRFSVVGMFD